jgi:hypothetical protein
VRTENVSNVKKNRKKKTYSIDELHNNQYSIDELHSIDELEIFDHERSIQTCVCVWMHNWHFSLWTGVMNTTMKRNEKHYNDNLSDGRTQEPGS